MRPEPGAGAGAGADAGAGAGTLVLVQHLAVERAARRGAANQNGMCENNRSCVVLASSFSFPFSFYYTIRLAPRLIYYHRHFACF